MHRVYYALYILLRHTLFFTFIVLVAFVVSTAEDLNTSVKTCTLPLINSMLINFVRGRLLVTVPKNALFSSCRKDAHRGLSRAVQGSLL